MMHFWDRVYINLGTDFSLGQSGLDFEALIDEVAIHKRSYDGIALLEQYSSEYTHIFRGRTKKFIVQEVNKFIADLGEVQSSYDNMASFTSKRQLNRLIDAFRGHNKRVSAYSLIIIYVMAVVILNNPRQTNFDFSKLQDTVNCICKWIQEYSEEYKDDELAIFLLDCFKTVSAALQNKDTQVVAEDFPDIPKRNPSDRLDD